MSFKGLIKTAADVEKRWKYQFLYMITEVNQFSDE